MADKHRPAILAALAATGTAAAIRQALKVTSDIADHPGVSSVVQQAIEHNVTTDPAKMSTVIQNIYREAMKVVPDGFTPLETPGPRLTALLNTADQAAKEIAGTTLSRLRSTITDGITSGKTYSQIGTDVNAVINDFSRADTIAVTEASTAYSQGAIDTLEASGATEWYWIAYEGSCPECEDQESSNPHAMGDDPPPLHPNCRCDISDSA